MRRRQVGLDSSDRASASNQLDNDNDNDDDNNNNSFTNINNPQTKGSGTGNTKKSSSSGFPVLRFTLQFTISFGIIVGLYYLVEIYDQGKLRKRKHSTHHTHKHVVRCDM